MNQVLGENSVINQWLTTAADGLNCGSAQYRPLAIEPLRILYTPCRESRLQDLAMFPICDAVRRKLSWTHYRLLLRGMNSAATVKESLSVQTKSKIGVSGCASADHFRGVTKLIAYGKRWASDRFATRRVANSIGAARKATTEKSSAVQSEVSDHFRGATKMVEPGNSRRRHHDGR